MAINVLDALRDVHRAGFIHRDVKPHNIIRVDCGDGSWMCVFILHALLAGLPFNFQSRGGVPALSLPACLPAGLPASPQPAALIPQGLVAHAHAHAWSQAQPPPL